MTRLPRALSVALATLLASATLAAQRPPRTTLAELTFRAADADGDGRVTPAERTTFLDRFPAPPTSLDRFKVLATLLRPRADTDADDAITRSDLEPAFTNLDRDEDGTVPAAERNARRRGNASLLDAIVVKAADHDADGTTTRAEWQSFLADLDGPVPTATFATWLRSASQPEADDRAAFTPAVWLLTIDATLDVDGDGKRTRDDLAQTLTTLDVDGDGTIDRSDRQAARRRNREQARQRDDTAPSPEDLPPGHLPRRPITAADRARPPLVPFQRSLADALALAGSSGKPLLICVNMDDEPASERFAWQYYRDPAFADLTRGFVPVIASPDDHAPRSHDDHGRRIQDPRFGRVIDTEHQDIEPELHARYFQGRRVAPRHLAVTADGTLLFDLYLLDDLNRVADALREHGVFDRDLPRADPGDNAALLASPDAAHRTLLEHRFPAAPRATRLDLTARALAAKDGPRHPELIRLALHDPDPTVRHQAARALAEHARPADAELLRPACREIAGDHALAIRLVDRLHTLLATTDPGDPHATQLRRSAQLQAALRTRSRLLTPSAYARLLDSRPGQPQAVTAADFDHLDRTLGLLQDQRRNLAERHPDAPTLRDLDLRLARTSADFAQALILRNQDPGFVFDDVRRLAARVHTAATPHAEAAALSAYASHMLGDTDRALAAALTALPELTGSAEHSDTWLTRELLALFTRIRSQQLYDALRDERPWPAHLVADVRAAYDCLLAHPLCTVQDAAAYLDWLDVTGGWWIEGRAVRRALRRFPTAAAIHERFRGQLLRDAGAAATERAYAELPRNPDTSAAIQWFAGVASLAAAERHVQNDPRTQHPGAALDAYRRAHDQLRESVRREAAYESSAAHWICIAQAGAARVHLRSGNLAAAQLDLRAALQAHPAAATAADGLGNTPAQTAGLLLRALRDAGDESSTQAADDLTDLLQKLEISPEFPTPADRR